MNGVCGVMSGAATTSVEQSDAMSASLSQGTYGVGASGDDDSRLVVWTTIIDMPLIAIKRHSTFGSIEEASRELRRDSDRLERASALLEAVQSISGQRDWKVSVTRRHLRLEHRGQAFSQLEQLLQEDFCDDHVNVRVEYARAWGML